MTSLGKRILRSFAIALTLSVVAEVALAQPAIAAPDPVMQGAVDGVIRPRIIGFARETTALVSAMEVLCATPSQQGLEIARSQLRQAVLAFARIEVIRLGPLLEKNRAERLLFWPDREGVGLREVQAILTEEDEAATDVAGLGEKSAAVQGLGALEYILFASSAEGLAGPQGDFQCRFGLAIARNAATIARELATGWYRPGGVAQHLLSPSPHYDYLRSHKDAAKALILLMSQGLETLRTTRLKPLIASDSTTADPERALFWRSGLTLPMLRANMEGLRDLFVVSGVGLQLPPKERGIANTIEFEFRNAERALALVTLPVEQAVADPAQLQALNSLMIVMQSLVSLMSEQLPAALDLSVSVSSLDRLAPSPRISAIADRLDRAAAGALLQT